MTIDPAWAVAVGALFGGLVTVAGTFLQNRHQLKLAEKQRKWDVEDSGRAELLSEAEERKTALRDAIVAVSNLAHHYKTYPEMHPPDDLVKEAQSAIVLVLLNSDRLKGENTEKDLRLLLEQPAEPHAMIARDALLEIKIDDFVRPAED